jgi:hypothetical protein
MKSIDFMELAASSPCSNWSLHKGFHWSWSAITVFRLVFTFGFPRELKRYHCVQTGLYIRVSTGAVASLLRPNWSLHCFHLKLYIRVLCCMPYQYQSIPIPIQITVMIHVQGKEDQLWTLCNFLIQTRNFNIFLALHILAWRHPQGQHNACKSGCRIYRSYVLIHHSSHLWSCNPVRQSSL